MVNRIMNNDKVLEKSITIDAVIPVYKPGEEFDKLLERLQKQKRKLEHIFLMHTEDGTDLSWAEEKYENVKVLSVKKEEFDHGATRDKGIRNSNADVVLCMTQDAIPVNSYLTMNLVQALLMDDEVVVAYGRQVPKNDCEILERYTRKFNYPEESRIKSAEDLKELGIKTYFCSNVCAAYRREKYEEMGGFEKNTIFNEDMIFAAKVIENGFKIAYEANALVIHSHNYSNIQQLKRNFDLAVSQTQHPEIFERVKSESEGIRMVMETAKYLIKKGHLFLIISLVLKSGCKYLGYQLGKHYRILPESFIIRVTMNPGYWRKSKNQR